MLKNKFHHDYYGNKSELEAKQQHQLPDHLKCGEVYTWLCAGELYAVECKLCEDHPLCPLSEFPEHMDIWHTNWETANQKYEKNNINLQFTVNGEENQDDDDILSSFCNNDVSSLIAPGHQVQKENVENHQKPDIQNSEEILEPFEQVLIEQDYTTESTQINEHLNEEEYFKDVNEQVADIEQCQAKNKHKQKLHSNAKQTLKPTTDKQRLEEKQITENERDLQYLKELQQSDKEFNVNNRKMLLSKSDCLFNIKSKNSEKKWGNVEQKIKNSKEKHNKNLQETSGSETSDEENFETKNVLKKSNIKCNIKNIRQIKQTLNTIVKAISELNEFEEIEGETNDFDKSNEYQNIEELRTKRTQGSKSVQNNLNPKHNVRNNLNKIEKTFEVKIAENETETGEIEKKTTENKTYKLKKQIEKTEGLNKSNKKHKKLLQSFSGIQEITEIANNETIETKNSGNLRESKSKTSKNETIESQTCKNKTKSRKIQPEINGLEATTNKNVLETNENETNTATKNIENSLSKKESNLIKFQKSRKSKRIAIEDLKTLNEVPTNKTKLGKYKTRAKKQFEIEKTKNEVSAEINEDNEKLEQSKKSVPRNQRERNEHETKLTLNNKELNEIETELNETRENETELSENELYNNKIQMSGNQTEQGQIEIKLSDDQIYFQEENIKQNKNIDELNKNRTRHDKNESRLNDVEENKTETNETMEKIKVQLNLSESETLLDESKTEMYVNAKETIDERFIECVLTSFETRKKAEKLIRRHRKKLKGDKKRSKNPPDVNFIGTKLNRNETTMKKISLSEGEQNEIETEVIENETAKNQREEKFEVESTANEIEPKLLKNNSTKIKTQTCEHEIGTNENKIIDNKFIECVLNSFDSIKKANCLIRKKIKSRKKLKEIDKYLKSFPTQNGSETDFSKTKITLTENKKVPGKVQENPSENNTRTNHNVEENKVDFETNESGTLLNTEKILVNESSIELCKHEKEMKIRKRAGKKLKGKRKRKKSKQLKDIKKQLIVLSEDKNKTGENRVEQNEIEMNLNEKEVEINNPSLNTKGVESPLNSNMVIGNTTHSSGIETETKEHETINMMLGTKVEHFYYSHKQIRKNYDDNEMEQNEIETEKIKTELSENGKQHKEHITKKTENEKQLKEIVGETNENKTETNESNENNKVQLSFKESSKSQHKTKSALKLNENKTKICDMGKETSENETVDAKFIECMSKSYNLRKEAEKVLIRKRKMLTEQTGSETKKDENKIVCSKINLKDEECLKFAKSNGRQKEFFKNEINSREEKRRATEQQQELSEIYENVMEHLEKYKSLELKEKIKSRRLKTTTITGELSEEEQKEIELFDSPCKKSRKNHKISSKTVQQVHINNPFRQSKIDYDALESKSRSRDPLNPVKRIESKSCCETNEDADSSTKFSENSECVEELSDPFPPASTRRSKSVCEAMEQNKEDFNSWKNGESRMRTCESETTSRKEVNGKNIKQTLWTQVFGKEITKSPDNTLTSSDSASPQHYVGQDISDNTSTSLNSVSLKGLEEEKCSVGKDTEPLSPLSPKTEEEHFEFYEPQKEKLNQQHIKHLIKLYQEQPHLWDQSHPDFCEPEICRKSWQQITEQWNQFCQRQFTVAEVRIRICTLCQRFVQERERLALEGELDEFAKFPYYEQMQFLEQQKTLQKRRELYEQQNEQILEIYENFPILWHIGHYKLRQAKKRAQAFESIHHALKLCGLNLSIFDVHKRIRSLRKCYRLEKIRYLHARVEQTSYVAEFPHFERMQFLDKHIEPFVCRICDKIFENFQNYREHLELENHGSILPEESDAEIDSDIEMVKNENQAVILSPSSNQMDSFSESENSRDILQRFSPLTCSPNHSNISTLEMVTSDNASSSSSYNQQDLKFPLNTVNDPVINSLNFEDHLIEEIMENVTNNDSLSQPGLDQFINSMTNCEGMSTDNCLSQEMFNSDLLPAQNSFVIEDPDIVGSDQILCNVSPKSNMENGSNGFSYVVEHPDVVTDGRMGFLDPVSNVENFVLEPGNTFALEHFDLGTDTIVAEEKECTPPQPAWEENSSLVQGNTTECSPTSEHLIVKDHCSDYAIDLNLNSETLQENLCPSNYDSDKEIYSSADISTIPLADHLIHKMIEFYRKYPQLWNPNHLDFNSRNLRRQAWCSLTTEFNSAVGEQFSWRTLHRKLADYAKYYKKLITEQENYEQLENKWIFYEDFKFMDDVIAVQNELQRSVHHRDNNFKIIAIYKTFPQLWDINHKDYNKRSTKQRNIELMCNRLQEENNLQLTTERLKNRLIELRTQYRVAKKQRLKCLKNQQEFSSNDFEFYEALRFLDDHIDPFVCDKCKMEFKKLTAYNQHLKKEHSPKLGHKKLSLAAVSCEPGVENNCHICGIKFSTRSNLLHHIKRHEGIRNYECSLCPKTFYASYALKVHIRSHTKECPYTCEKCGLSFVSASKLNQHFKRHLNRKDYKCDYCPKAFFTAYERDRHTKRHLNIRDKVCPICGKTFVAGSSYYAHLMLHSDTKRFQCDKCDMKFTQYPGLYKHKKRHHK